MLDKILAATRKRVDESAARVPIERLKERAAGSPPKRSLSAAVLRPPISVIAEIKGSSPTLGTINADFDPIELANEYEQAAAAAISVLTEPEFFGGSLERLLSVKEAVSVPILRKDFIIDPYQIYEAAAYGADALLLIAGAVPDDENRELIAIAHELGLETLTEAMDSEQLLFTLSTDTDIVGINNRDLRTLEIDPSRSFDLLRRAKESLAGRPIVAESGVENRSQVAALENAGFDAILVGTALMKSGDATGKIKELLAVQSTRRD